MANKPNGFAESDITGRRKRSSCSTSEADTLADTLRVDMTDGQVRFCSSRQRKCKSLYGAIPICKFGPKACLQESKDTVLTIQEPGSQVLSWFKPPQTILLIKKIYDDTIDEPFVELAQWLVESKNLQVFVEKKALTELLLTNHPCIECKLNVFDEGTTNIHDKIDLIICMGGDGTLLYASTLFQESVPPVLAFHLGSLGFLSTFDFSDYKEAISQALRDNQAHLMLRTRLKCNLIRRKVDPADGINELSLSDKERHQFLVLNEVVVDRGSTPYLCMLDLYIEDRHVTVVQGDGLIISTPTGSTAYAAAAGASMLHPNVPAIVIAPVCPHSLSFRPIIVPAGVEIKVCISPDARDSAQVSFDGRDRQDMHKGDELMISTSKYPLPSICSTNPISDWFDSLAGCLHWNERRAQLRFTASQDK